MSSAPKPPKPAEANLAEAQQLLQLWVRLKAFLTKADSTDPISREEEQAFLDTKSEISRSQRTILAKLPLGVTIAPDRLQEIMRQSISISHVRVLPKTDRTVLLANWHYVFIFVSQAVGGFQFVAEGYNPPPRTEKKGTGLKDLKGAASHGNKKKKSRLKSPLLWIVLIGIAVAAFMAFGDG